MQPSASDMKRLTRFPLSTESARARADKAVELASHRGRGVEVVPRSQPHRMFLSKEEFCSYAKPHFFNA
jgi:hypothetical protein